MLHLCIILKGDNLKERFEGEYLYVKRGWIVGETEAYQFVKKNIVI